MPERASNSNIILRVTGVSHWSEKALNICNATQILNLNRDDAAGFHISYTVV